jgi:hypothetical protein
VRVLLQPTSDRRRIDLLNFQTFLLDAEEAGTKVTDIPNVHCGVIVIAGHES